MDRRPTTQDVTWLLDLNKNKQLDLTPPYQRRSVWTPKDRRYFLDTIFRNYPSPAIFLHKKISTEGSVVYEVVDGKQRLETIFRFAANQIRIAANYGDIRLDNKRWKDLVGNVELKNRFWNYQITVEMIDVIDGELVNDVFDRLNRNSRKLTAQELRHARFDGWFISRAEAEAEFEVWKDLGISTRARSSRMTDVQFVSELMAVLITSRPNGFGQEELDEIYAEYDDIDELEDFNEEDFNLKFDRAKEFLVDVNRHGDAVARWARGFGAFYTLWCVAALSHSLPESVVFSDRYDEFMRRVAHIDSLPAGASVPEGDAYVQAVRYREAARGASTEEAQRLERFNVLRAAVEA